MIPVRGLRALFGSKRPAPVKSLAPMRKVTPRYDPRPGGIREEWPSSPASKSRAMKERANDVEKRALSQSRPSPMKSLVDREAQSPRPPIRGKPPGDQRAMNANYQGRPRYQPTRLVSTHKDWEGAPSGTAARAAASSQQAATERAKILSKKTPAQLSQIKSLEAEYERNRIAYNKALQQRTGRHHDAMKALEKTSAKLAKLGIRK